MVLIIMAAGSGSRYGKLKQFDELGPCKEFLMEFSIYDAVRAGFNHIVLITRKENKEYIDEYLNKRLPKHIKIDIVIQDANNLPEGCKINSKREKPWGTAHAIWCAKNYVSGDFAIINADDFYGKNSFKNAFQYMSRKDNNKNFGLVCYKLSETLSEFGSVSRGVCKVENDKLVSINEYLKIQQENNIIFDLNTEKTLHEDDLVSMNFWICKNNFFIFLENYIIRCIRELKNIEKDEIYLPFAIKEYSELNKMEIDVLRSLSKWFGITYIEDKNESIKKLRELTENKLYPTPLW
jgi:UTP-glucose-1-phosphate uridylyltransferase